MSEKSSENVNPKKSRSHGATKNLRYHYMRHNSKWNQIKIVSMIGADNSTDWWMGHLDCRTGLAINNYVALNSI